MKNSVWILRKNRIFQRLVLTFALFIGLLLFAFSGLGNSVPTQASAASGDWIRIESCETEYTIRQDRKIEVKERIAVTFLRSGLTMFYHSLPMEGDRYYDIQASCAGNDEFFYNVAANPDVDGFLDINCVGGTEKGRTNVYDISYIMEIGVDDVKNGMHLDVIGFGSSVPIHNVKVRINFPAPISEADYTCYVGGYGVSEEDSKQIERTLSSDGKTLTLATDVLELAYNDKYDETMAMGISVKFTLGEGVLEDFTKTRLFTEDMWKILLAGGLCLIAAIVIRIFTRKNGEIITTVNVKAPDEMDPLKMGKYLDGVADSSDVTSMIYYFANQGYLNIDLTNEEDPELISRVSSLPDDAPVYQKTLFNGLFRAGRVVDSEKPFIEECSHTCRVVKISELTGTFFMDSQKAVKQTPTISPMYDKKSLLGFFGGSILAALLFLFVPFFMGLKIGGGYTYFFGIILAVPMALILLFAYIRENYRYKWKSGAKFWMLFVEFLLAALSILIFTLAAAKFIMTGYEKLVLSLFGFASCFVTLGALSRSEKCKQALGDILGFKEFIEVTESEKIKFMLEENPELYYKILPYAQVLGVTKEWEEKFADILIEPPVWFVGGNFDMFDYLILSNCMNRAMTAAAMKAQSGNGKGGGGFIGMSGGGGGFGGFGGGGHGGGGFGAR